MESFWELLKNELAHHQKFKTLLQAIQEISEYIEIFYNRQRKQEKLGFLSPAEFTQRCYANLFAALITSTSYLTTHLTLLSEGNLKVFIPEMI